MNLLVTLKESLSLLSPRSRRQLWVATIAQAATAFLDLAGILTLGIVVALSLAEVSGEPLPSVLLDLGTLLGVSVEDLQRSLPLLALTGALMLVWKSLLSLYLARRITRFLALRQAEVSSTLIASVLAWPASEIRQANSQRLAYALTGGVTLATTAVLGQAVIAFAEIVLLAVLISGLFFISAWITAFAILYLGIVGLILHLVIASNASRVGQQAAEVEIESRSVLQEGLASYAELSVLERKWFVLGHLRSLRFKAAELTARGQVIGGLPKYVFEIALIIGAVLLVVAQLGSRQLPAAMGTISVFLIAGSRIVPSLQRLQTAGITIRQSAAGASATFELALRASQEQPCEPVEPSWPTAKITYTGFEPTVVLNRVSFAYAGSQERAVSDVSFTSPAGSSIALVGPSGAGKSTVANVILGLQKPDSGDALLGGLEPTQAISKWPGAIAYVPQDVAVLDATIRENVALGVPREHIDEGLVMEALESARLMDFLNSKREGLETVVGERGAKLSGGQRQRLGLARALYSKPKLLVLDEATSALDAETERFVADALASLANRVTTVTIAHRLATVRDADLVVYLDNGRLLAAGSFDTVRSLVPDFDRQAQLLGL